jgi:hypothetical protein
MLMMEARVKTTYPNAPLEIRNEFNARLSAKGYTEDAWQAAVVWLQSTGWFRVRARYLGNP